MTTTAPTPSTLMIITIDGPSGTGKSTVARELAKRIGFTYFDTGAMYRAFTHLVVKEGIDYENEEALKQALANFTYHIRLIGAEKRYFANGEDITEDIRNPEVTAMVSTIAAISPVRTALVNIQKDYGHRVNAVFEGRDLGTVVFPGAELKIFLTADADTRATRRLDELKTKNPEKFANLAHETVKEQIEKRDDKDSTREVSPLRQAEDAHLIDTSNLTIDEVIQAILIQRDQIGA